MSACKHGIEESWCASCKTTEPRTLVLEGPTIASRFSGKCPGCGDPIVEGEDIHLTDAGWVCTDCSKRAVSA